MSGSIMPPQCCFFLKIALVTDFFSSFFSPKQIMTLFYFCEKVIGILIGIALNLLIAVFSMNISLALIFLIQNYLLISPIFSIIFFASILFTSTLILVISILLLSLGFVSSYLTSLRNKIRLFIGTSCF